MSLKLLTIPYSDSNAARAGDAGADAGAARDNCSVEAGGSTDARDCQSDDCGGGYTDGGSNCSSVQDVFGNNHVGCLRIAKEDVLRSLVRPWSGS